MKPKIEANARLTVPGADESTIKYPIFSEAHLSSRWNLAPKSRAVLETGRIQGVKIGPKPARLQGNQSFFKNFDFQTNFWFFW
ncbi:MAG: hypothetical protein LBU76_09095 [Azoarcus sp.]|jgi:hypothetical protein|nr:hypothetical protein [Azoarcus sp.]